jgi:hypothetical protein
MMYLSAVFCFFLQFSYAWVSLNFLVCGVIVFIKFRIIHHYSVINVSPFKNVIFLHRTN